MFGRKSRLLIEAEALGDSIGIDQILSNPDGDWDRDVDNFLEASKNILDQIHKQAENKIISTQKSMKNVYDKKLKRTDR